MTSLSLYLLLLLPFVLSLALYLGYRVLMLDWRHNAEQQELDRLMAELLASAGQVRAAASGAVPGWAKTLGLVLPASEAQIRAAFRRLSKQAHPDVPGGSNEAMHALNEARRKALAWVAQRGR